MTSTGEDGVESQTSRNDSVGLGSIEKWIFLGLSSFKTPWAASSMLSKLKPMSLLERDHLYSCYSQYWKYSGRQSRRGYPKKGKNS